MMAQKYGAFVGNSTASKPWPRCTMFGQGYRTPLHLAKCTTKLSFGYLVKQPAARHSLRSLVRELYRLAVMHMLLSLHLFTAYTCYMLAEQLLVTLRREFCEKQGMGLILRFDCIAIWPKPRILGDVQFPRSSHERAKYFILIYEWPLH